MQALQFETNARGGWVVPAYTSLPSWVEVPAWSEIGNGCTLGTCCTLGAGAQWLGVTVQSWLTLANVDGSGRQVKVVKHDGGVVVEAGCFQGTLEEFCAKAASEGKGRYVRVVSAVAAAM